MNSKTGHPTRQARTPFWRYLAGIALLALASTAMARAEVPKVKLRVSNLPNPSITEPVNLANCRAVNRFLQLNPDVELVPAEGLRLENMNPEVTTIMMIAGNIAPDVLVMKFRSIDSFVSKGMVAPLDANVAEAELAGFDPARRIPPYVRDVVYRSGPDGERHLYGLPLPPFVAGLYYNRELFREAGLPDRAPRDWDEMLQFARKIRALGSQYKPITFNAGPSAAWDLMNFIWSAGGEALTEIAPGEWRAAFNTPEVVTAIEFYYQLVEIEQLAVRLHGTPTTQERAETGMFFDSVGDTVRIDPERFAFGTVPKGPTGIRASQINAWILGIYSGISDPRVGDAAWRYVSFMTGPEAERVRVETMVELGQAAQVNPVTLRQQGYEAFLNLTPPGLEQEFEEALRNARPEPYGRNCNQIYLEMTFPLDRILLSNEIRRAWLAGNRKEVRARIQVILDAAVQRTNERMIGYVTPEAMQLRRRVAAGVILGLCSVFVAVGWNISRLFVRSGAAMPRPVAGRGLLPWLCLLPALGLILVWNYLPLARGTIMAFQDYELILDSSFVGLDNFANVLFDPTFWNSILATFHFALYTLTFGFVTPILLAYALHLIPKYKILYRTVYYLPAVMSAGAIFFLWRELFGVDGPLNEALRLLGFEARRAWTDEPRLAMLSCAIPGIWAGAGPGCLIYLAALKTIPEEQFEAAEIDGAGFWSKTTQIVLPSLNALIFINFVGAVAAAFHGATNILIMTGGGPEGLTEVASLKIFYEAFTRLRFGPATAMAWILGSMLIGLTVMQLKRISQMEFKTAK